MENQLLTKEFSSDQLSCTVDQRKILLWAVDFPCIKYMLNVDAFVCSVSVSGSVSRARVRRAATTLCSTMSFRPCARLLTRTDDTAPLMMSPAQDLSTVLCTLCDIFILTVWRTPECWSCS